MYANIEYDVLYVLDVYVLDDIVLLYDLFRLYICAVPVR